MSAATKRTEDHAQQSDWVARDPNAIGVVGIAYQRNAKPLKIETSCGLITDPNVFSMKTEEYPLSRRLYLYTSGRPKTPLGRQLLDYALSPAAQPIVSSVDFINQAPETLSFARQQTRVLYALNAEAEDFNMTLMRQMIEEMKPTSRLSSTFRFQLGSFTLDTKAQQDISRLVNVLKTDDSVKGKSIVLAGFADSVGSFESNLRLSRNRANAVRNAILNAPEGRQFAPQIEVKAYSELAPVACNDNDKGRQFNRRVEVWVR